MSSLVNLKLSGTTQAPVRFDIRVDQRWFVQVIPVGQEEIAVEARVDVDDRNVLSEAGLILLADPWRFAYLFNQNVTREIDIVL